MGPTEKQKTMRKLVVAALVVSSLWACKKSPNDPQFVLASRKARLTGDWVLTQAEFRAKDTLSTYSDSTLVVKRNNQTLDSLLYTHSANFDKDGNYSFNTYSQSLKFSALPTITTEILGIWNFGGGEVDVPNKTVLFLVPESYTTFESSDGNNVDILKLTGATAAERYFIDRLANDELVINYFRIDATPTTSDTFSTQLTFTKLND